MEAKSPVLSEELVDKEIVYAKDQSEYKPLPVLKNKQGIVLSRWRLTDKEREAVVNGADIFLSVWTFNQPLQPLYLEVAECDRSLLDIAKWIDVI